MTTHTTRSDALAEVLREHPPALDDLARARLEKRVVAAAAAPRSSRRPRAALAAGGVIALAAAVALIVLAQRRDEAAPIARFERREAAASVERGTLEEGSSLRTAAGEVAEIRVDASRVRIEGDSRVRIARLASERLALELGEGVVEVAFHPRERGREQLTVQTPNARVEVVGTVFRVTAREGATEVSVSEGTVRVVPLEGGEPRLVHAGETTTVDRDAPAPHGARAPASSEASAATEATALAEAGEATEESGAPASRPEPPPEPEAPSGDEPAPPAARLERAHRLINAGRAPAALRELRELTRASVPRDVRVEAWSLTGDVYGGAGRLRAAARAYESAAREGRGTPGGHNAIYSLARLQHRRLDDPAAARASYARYLAAAPHGALASQARRALCSLGASEHCGERP